MRTTKRNIHRARWNSRRPKLSSQRRTSLKSIFDKGRCQLKNQEVLDLFYRLSRHSLSRDVAGWEHEQRVHNHLGTGRVALKIFRDNIESTKELSIRLPSGTLGGLKIRRQRFLNLLLGADWIKLPGG